MRARLPQQIQRFRPATARRGHQRDTEPVDREIAPVGPEARVREAGGPDDRAHYACSCGMVFQASVSTSVACPHCGTGQAW